MSTIVNINSGSDFMNPTSFLFLFTLMGREAVSYFPQSGEVEDRWGWLPSPTYFRKTVTLSPEPGEAFTPHRVVLGSARLRVVMESTAALPVPCWGTWLRSKNQETLSTKALCPLAAHHNGAPLCSGFKQRSEFQRGVASHLVGISVAVGNTLSMTPTQQDKVLPNSLGLVLFGDKFLFSQGVTFVLQRVEKLCDFGFGR